MSREVTITDTSGNSSTTKAGSTAAAAGDTALVVALSPNSPTPSFGDTTGTGSLGANNATVTVTTTGMSSLTVNITGTWSATINFQATTDGSTWFNIQGFNNANFSTSLAAATFATTTANGSFSFEVGGFKQFRLLMTPYTSGSASIAYDAGAGNNSIGLLSVVAANTGTAATDFTGTGNLTGSGQTVSVNGQGVYTVTASVTGTWSATLVAEGQLADSTWVIIPMYILSSSSLPYTSTFSTTTNGTYIITGGGFQNIRIRASAYTSGTVAVSLDGSLSQQTVFTSQLGTWAMSVPCVPSARTVKIYECSTTAGVTTEAMLTLTPLSGFVAGSTGTSFSVTSGKTFRIQAINVSVRTTATNSSASAIVRLRISSSGAVTTGTTPAASVAALTGNATTTVVGWAASDQMIFPDGLELSGTMQFGLSQLASATSTTIDAQIIGFEY